MDDEIVIVLRDGPSSQGGPSKIFTAHLEVTNDAPVHRLVRVENHLNKQLEEEERFSRESIVRHTGSTRHTIKNRFENALRDLVTSCMEANFEGRPRPPISFRHDCTDPSTGDSQLSDLGATGAESTLNASQTDQTGTATADQGLEQEDSATMKEHWDHGNFWGEGETSDDARRGPAR